MYYRWLSSNNLICLLLYVNDMLIACKHKVEIEKLKNELNTIFEMKDLGPATRILGMQIRRDKHARTLFLTQLDMLKGSSTGLG